jgi:hypothetical protein
MANNIMANLLRWIDDPRRKTLIVLGGWNFLKNRLIRRLAPGSNRVLAEVDLSKSGSAALFEGDDPAEMISRLEKALGKEIDPDRSILFLNGMKNCPELLGKIKYIAQSFPKLPLVVNGSGLESHIKTYEKELPDKGVAYMRYSPYSFNEFLGDVSQSRTMYRVKQDE